MSTKIGCLAAAVVLASCGATHGHASPDGDSCRPAVTAEERAAFAKEGFVVEIDGGLLWVRRPEQAAGGDFVTWTGAGPGGRTVRAPDDDTALAYVATRPGFRVEIDEGRVWVLRAGQERSERSVTLVGAGPRGATLKAVDRETLDAYLDA